MEGLTREIGGFIASMRGHAVPQACLDVAAKGVDLFSLSKVTVGELV
jgi:hypothetical protein